MDYLTLRGIYHYRNNTAGIFVPASGSYRPSHSKGAADIIGILTVHGIGVFLAIEVKRPGGRQSPDQKAFEQNVKRAGGYYYIVTSVEETEAAIKETAKAVETLIAGSKLF